VAEEQIKSISPENYSGCIGNTVSVCVEAGGGASKCFSGILIDVQPDYIRLLRMAGRSSNHKTFRPYRCYPGIRVNRYLSADTWRRVMISIAIDKIVSFTMFKPKAISPEIFFKKPAPPLPPMLLIFLLLLLLSRHHD